MNERAIRKKISYFLLLTPNVSSPSQTNMDSSIPSQNPSLNPNNNCAAATLTPHHTTADGVAPTLGFHVADPQRRRRRIPLPRAMENLTALAIKLATSDPNRPLTPARKALIEERLHQLFSDFHTPNHPAYAAMIHRAIVELKEKEGSTEGSISEFICKEYDDLPWAHVTLLKHHLQKLCESGEIIVTSDERYLLVDGSTNLTSGPCPSPNREPIQPKRKGQKLQGQGRRHKKRQIKEQDQANGEQIAMIQGPNQVQEQHNLVIEGQTLVEEQSTKQIKELNVLQARRREQGKQSVLVEEKNQLERQINSELRQQNQSEIPGLERPPGFDLVTVEFSRLHEQQLPEASPLIYGQRESPICQLETMALSIDFPINDEKLQVKQQHEHPYPEGLPGTTTLLPPPTSKTSADDSQLVDQEKQPNFCNSERPLELCVPQKTCRCLPLNSEPTQQCELELPDSGQFLETQMMIDGEVDEFSCTLKQLLVEQRQLCQSQRQSEHLTELLPSSETQHRDPELPNEETPMKLKQTLAGESTQSTEQGKLCDEEIQIKSQPKTNDFSNMSIALLHSKQKQPTELPSAERPQKLHQTPEKPQHRPLNPEPEKATTSTTIELLPQQHQPQDHLQLQNRETPQEFEQIPAEDSTQRECQRPKLNRRLKMLISQEKMQKGSLDSRMASQQEPELLPVVPSLEIAKEQPDQQAQKNSYRLKLRPRCPKYEIAAASTTPKLMTMQDQLKEQRQLDCQDQERLKQKSDMSSTALKSSPSDLQNQHEQNLPVSRGRGRPRKYLHNPQQQQKTKGRGRGRPPKPKPDVMESVLPSEKQQYLHNPQ